MKKYFLFLSVIFVFCLQAKEDLESVNQTSQTENSSVDSQVKQDKVKQDNKENKRFVPPLVLTHSYGVFKVGYAYQYQNAGTISKNGGTPFELNQSGNAIYFGIERGWIGGWKKSIMLGGYFDGALGQVYFLSLGFKASMFLLNGWLVPYIGVGYQFEHLGFSQDTTQYNMHTAVFSIGTHVNIAKGFGIDLQLRSGLPFYMVSRSDANAYGNPHINHVGFMISFSFYDFSI